jgi:GAF domain-containing protein
MPYVRCPGCDLTTYSVRGEHCPRCDTPLVVPASPSTPETMLDEALALVRRELDVDVALITEVTDRHEVVQRVDAAVGVDAPEVSLSVPLAETICERLLSGRVPPVIGDVRAEPELADVPHVRAGAIGAYLGVPLTTVDARLYVLCCLSRERRPDLGDREYRFLRGVAETIRAALERTPA